MVGTTFVSREPVRASEAQSELILQIRGGPRDGQAVRLRSAKCTIGSGPDCTLQLLAAGVRAGALPYPPRSGRHDRPLLVARYSVERSSLHRRNAMPRATGFRSGGSNWRLSATNGRRHRSPTKTPGSPSNPSQTLPAPIRRRLECNGAAVEEGQAAVEAQRRILQTDQASLETERSGLSDAQGGLRASGRRLCPMARPFKPSGTA